MGADATEQEERSTRGSCRESNLFPFFPISFLFMEMKAMPWQASWKFSCPRETLFAARKLNRQDTEETHVFVRGGKRGDANRNGGRTPSQPPTCAARQVEVPLGSCSQLHVCWKRPCGCQRCAQKGYCQWEGSSLCRP